MRGDFEVLHADDEGQIHRRSMFSNFNVDIVFVENLRMSEFWPREAWLKGG